MYTKTFIISFIAVSSLPDFPQWTRGWNCCTTQYVHCLITPSPTVTSTSRSRITSGIQNLSCVNLPNEGKCRNISLPLKIDNGSFSNYSESSMQDFRFCFTDKWTSVRINPYFSDMPPHSLISSAWRTMIGSPGQHGWKTDTDNQYWCCSPGDWKQFVQITNLITTSISKNASLSLQIKPAFVSASTPAQVWKQPYV